MAGAGPRAGVPGRGATLSHQAKFNHAASGRPVAQWRYMGSLISDIGIGWRTKRRRSKMRDCLVADGLLVEMEGVLVPTPFGLLQYSSWVVNRE